MVDISMCGNKECKLKDTCYRYLAKPDEYAQTYGLFCPSDDSHCEFYWEANDEGTIALYNKIHQ